MKVAMVVSHMDENIGGHEYYLCRELGRAGHDVTLYTSDRSVPGYPNRGERHNRKEYELVGFTVKRIPAFLQVSHIPLMLRLPRELRQDKPDVIHSHEFFQLCSFYSAKVAKRLAVPFILSQHGYKKPLNKVLWPPYYLSEKTVGRYVMNCADKIIALTPDVKGYLVRRNIPESKVEVVTTGVSTGLYSPSADSILWRYGITGEDKVVLFVGRLVENKGIIYLLKSFAKVNDLVTNAKLVIVGSGELERDLKKLAEDLFIRDSVLFLGNLPQKIMPHIYSGADVFVLSTIYKEPFGIAAVEALASGVPVIASNIDGLKVIVEDGEVGYLVSPRDVDAIANRITRILTNRNLRENLRRNARRRAVKEFSWIAKAKRIAEIYEEACRA